MTDDQDNSGPPFFFTRQSVNESLLKIGKNDLQHWGEWRERLDREGENAYIEASHHQDILDSGWRDVFARVKDEDWERNPYWMESLRHRVDETVNYRIRQAQKQIAKSTAVLAELGDNEGMSTPKRYTPERLWRGVADLHTHTIKHWTEIRDRLKKNGEPAYLEMTHDQQIVGNGWKELLDSAPNTEGEEYAAWLAAVKEHLDAVVEFQIRNAENGLARAKAKLASGDFG